MAADLLAKAEAATTALGQQMAELLSQQQRNSSNGRSRIETDTDVSRLEAERLEAARRAESAEAEAELLRKQLELLAEDVRGAEADPMQMYNVKVLEELAAAQSLATAAQTELIELRRQNKAFQKEIATLRKGLSGGAAVNGKVNGANGAKGKEVCHVVLIPCVKTMCQPPVRGRSRNRAPPHAPDTCPLRSFHAPLCTPPHRMRAWSQRCRVWRSWSAKTKPCRRRLPSETSYWHTAKSLSRATCRRAPHCLTKTDSLEGGVWRRRLWCWRAHCVAGCIDEWRAVADSMRIQGNCTSCCTRMLHVVG